jgi:hypothetical protein
VVDGRGGGLRHEMAIFRQILPCFGENLSQFANICIKKQNSLIIKGLICNWQVVCYIDLLIKDENNEKIP